MAFNVKERIYIKYIQNEWRKYKNRKKKYNILLPNEIKQILNIKKLLNKPKKIMISPMEMEYNESIDYLIKYMPYVYCVQFDGSDNNKLAYKWIPMYKWAKILYELNNNIPYYLHIFSNNKEWINNQLLLCYNNNPNIIGVFIQIDILTSYYINNAIEIINILKNNINNKINYGLSLNANGLKKYKK